VISIYSSDFISLGYKYCKYIYIKQYRLFRFKRKANKNTGTGVALQELFYEQMNP